MSEQGGVNSPQILTGSALVSPLVAVAEQPLEAKGSLGQHRFHSQEEKQKRAATSAYSGAHPPRQSVSRCNFCVWIQCDSCKKWRRQSDANVRLPPESTDWFCALNADTNYQSCNVPQEIDGVLADQLGINVSLTNRDGTAVEPVRQKGGRELRPLRPPKVRNLHFAPERPLCAHFAPS